MIELMAVPSLAFKRLLGYKSSMSSISCAALDYVDSLTCLSFLSYSILILLLSQFNLDSPVAFLAQCYVIFSFIHLLLLAVVFSFLANVSAKL